MRAIFDLDGTLALVDHRRPLAKEHWPSFERSCVTDPPNKGVIAVYQSLYAVGWALTIWSGRSEKVRGYTEDWLAEQRLPFLALRMRGEHDQRRDDVMKESWLLELSSDQRPDIVFDDRDQVVSMWRRNGITCCQVAPGAF
jgi:hypothetical protein